MPYSGARWMKNQRQVTNEAELNEIQEKLEAFYGPYLQRSEEHRQPHD
jgi:hypothetical protein